ncbi:hypothetical protein [Rickettsiales endosymbiont of Stachyamoeba lipophora]|uniref:hypothetical protein n=1 Tax=Rickettsiales endosymbiont of Stachyamoeba lipophora TaxID=2486578 RepID=UPI000F64D48A|nr:hypothetical protein [Rickettsiales endosymbiont of Stachyamoeba lipophora]AZL16092.1 hypothetical protein EF513_06040 [Rickettsiales endosymbiont of Stachyamoeba lipophora]
MKQTRDDILKNYSFLYKEVTKNPGRPSSVFIKALDKVTISILDYYTRPKGSTAFKKPLIIAIEENHIIIIRKPLGINGRKIHVEMKIIQKLLEDKILNNTKEPIYIGISKKCCLHCEYIIRAINEKYSADIRREEDEDQDIPNASIETREEHGHGLIFPAGIPLFLHHKILF